MIGNVIVVLVLAVVIFLAARSLWRAKKRGGSCSDCSSCGCGCHHD